MLNDAIGELIERGIRRDKQRRSAGGIERRFRQHRVCARAEIERADHVRHHRVRGYIHGRDAFEPVGIDA